MKSAASNFLQSEYILKHYNFSHNPTISKQSGLKMHFYFKYNDILIFFFSTGGENFIQNHTTSTYYSVTCFFYITKIYVPRG